MARDQLNVMNFFNLPNEILFCGKLLRGAPEILESGPPRFQ